ncbi:hypothetical protein D3C78_1492390 [compost metagenome]
MPVTQISKGLYVERCTGIHRTLGLQTCSLDVDGVGRRRLSQGQVTIGIDLYIASTGGQITGQPHPDAGLGTDKLDRAGIHATQH